VDKLKLLEKKYILTQIKNFNRSEIRASSFEGGLRRMTVSNPKFIAIFRTKKSATDYSMTLLKLLVLLIS
jgi:hypothetical protein